jgi:hypothetical protein
MAAMKQAGITVVKSPAEMGEAVARLLPSAPARRRVAKGTVRAAAKPKARAKAKTSAKKAKRR